MGRGKKSKIGNCPGGLGLTVEETKKEKKGVRGFRSIKVKPGGHFFPGDAPGSVTSRVDLSQGSWKMEKKNTSNMNV